MYALGRNIDLPKSFIDLRHQITHDDEMPSLVVLRDFTKRALKWLYEDYWRYWRYLDDKAYIHDGIPRREDEDVKQQLEKVLGKHVLKCQKAFEKNDLHIAVEMNKKLSETASRAVTRICTRNCQGQVSLLQIVVDAYLKGGILIPTPNRYV